jgi:hypothetical protein
MVPVTDRLRLLGCSIFSIPDFLPSCIEASSSSGDMENMALDILFLAFLEARRKSSLFAASALLVIFDFVSGGTERTFSEKVRRMEGMAGSFSNAGI